MLRPPAAELHLSCRTRSLVPPEPFYFTPLQARGKASEAQKSFHARGKRPKAKGGGGMAVVA
jgi:hypothetical protein